MAELALPAVEQVREQMASTGFAVMRALLHPSYARVLQLSTCVLPERQVTCGIPNVTWAEQDIRPGHLLDRLLTGKLIRQFVFGAVSQPLAERTQCWPSRYVASQYIN